MVIQQLLGNENIVPYSDTNVDHTSLAIGEKHMFRYD